MSRYSAIAESQTAQLSGTPSGTTVNGYMFAVVPGASANLKLRRVRLGLRGPSGAITDQQIAVGVYLQTARASGTGFSTNTFNRTDPRARAASATGIDVTTATTLGTSGPTIGAQVDEIIFNSKSGYDIPFENLEEWIVDQGTANAYAFINLGQTLPASSICGIMVEIEE